MTLEHHLREVLGLYSLPGLCYRCAWYVSSLLDGLWVYAVGRLSPAVPLGLLL